MKTMWGLAVLFSAGAALGQPPTVAVPPLPSANPPLRAVPDGNAPPLPSLLPTMPAQTYVPPPPLPAAPPVYLTEDPLDARTVFQRPDRLWVRVGLVLGWSDRAKLPATWVPPATGTPVRFSESPSASERSGFLLDGGFWLDDARIHGFDASYLELGDCFRQIDGTPVPTSIGTYDNAIAHLGSWWDSADVNYRHNFLDRDALRVDGLIGYRYASLSDHARVGQVLPDPVDGAVIYRDRGAATNEFNGGQLGLAMTYTLDRWAFSATGKIALGTVLSRVRLSGDSAAALVGAPLDFGSSSQFAVLPSLTYDVSWRFWRNNYFTLGYQFQYLNRTVRGADAFGVYANPGSNPLQATSGFWAQGLTLGWQFKY
ncbi:MAG TPA: BBP7 family outer membrane beta-barrel protein [Fimbriiglobus sp.]|jgi:hypothetical protein